MLWRLDSRRAHRFPVPDASQLGMITLLVQHDAYHLGQLAFLRRQLGHPATAYTRGAGGSPGSGGGAA
jgi:uncharacterized damage-inducible protein DinB